MLSSHFSAALAANRAYFNARFSEAKRDRPGLSPAAFSAYLESSADAIVAAAAASCPERAAAVAAAAYDVGLELVGQGLAGPGAKDNRAEKCLVSLASAHPGFVAESPETVLASIANAAVRLAAAGQDASEKWAERLSTVAAAGAADGSCRSAADFLRLGSALAWLCGLPQYRESAIAVLESLPESLARASLGLGASADCAASISRLKLDPWYRPEAKRDAKGIEGALTIGAFRGFGGNFLSPPRVFSDGKRIFAECGKDAWTLYADAFGLALMGTRREDCPKDAIIPGLAEYIGKEADVIVLPGKKLRVDIDGALTGIALTAKTLACTSDLSHSIFIYPL